MLYAIDTLQKTNMVVILIKRFVAPRRDTSKVSVTAKPWTRLCRMLRGFKRRPEFVTLNASLLKSTTGRSYHVTSVGACSMVIYLIVHLFEYIQIVHLVILTDCTNLRLEVN